MKVKAVIMRPDRTNDVVVVKKRRIEGKTFRHNGTTYFLHPDRFQVTWTKKLFGAIKFYYSTFYYKAGLSNPLPVPNFTQLVKNVERVDETQEIVIGENGSQTTKQVRITGNVGEFKDVIDMGVTGEELAAIFNPWFYRIIAPVNKLREEITFYMLIGLCLAVAYVIYMLHSGNIVVSLPPAPTPAQPSIVP